jgi:hypothetical protein
MIREVAWIGAELVSSGRQIRQQKRMPASGSFHSMTGQSSAGTHTSAGNHFPSAVAGPNANDREAYACRISA